jgi:hypothetical protein
VAYLRKVLVSFLIIYIITSDASASYTYITTGSGKIVKVDISSGAYQNIASLPASISPDVIGIAYDDQGSIYLGTTLKSSSEWAMRVVKITPQLNGNAIVEPFTEAINARYTVGKIGFNSKGDLYVAGTSTRSVHQYNENGDLIGTIGLNGKVKSSVGLFIDGDTLYSIDYFFPNKIIQYDTSGSTPVGGVIAQLQFPRDYRATSITKSHTGNLAIGFSSRNHAGWAELWEYNVQTNVTHKLFDCKGPSGSSQYDAFTNRYLVGGTGLNVFDTQGNLTKTIDDVEWGSVGLISKTFVPESDTPPPVKLDKGNVSQGARFISKPFIAPESDTLLQKKSKSVLPPKVEGMMPGPVGWKVEDGGNGHYYLAVTWTKADWTNAQRYAKDIYGGHLVTITSQEEQKFIENYFDSLTPPIGRYWIGLREKSFEGFWGWISKEEFVYYNWRHNQPDDAGDREDHVEFTWGNKPGDGFYEARGTWNDMEHVHETYFIVEIEADSIHFPLQNGNQDGNYQKSIPADISSLNFEVQSDHNLSLEEANDELKQAKLNYESLLEKEKGLRESLAIREGRMKTAQAKADALERQEGDARSTKDRKEGQYRSVPFDSGARKPGSKEEQDTARRTTRGTTTKAGEARSLAEKERILFELAREDLSKVRAELNKANTTLNEKANAIDRLNNEKKLQELSLSDPNRRVPDSHKE